jgi:hypothetical protein
MWAYDRYYRWLNVVSLVLLIAGAVNWGLLGLFGVDLIATFFGPMSILSRSIYVLVGLAAVWELVRLPRISVCYLRPVQKPAMH